MRRALIGLLDQLVIKHQEIDQTINHRFTGFEIPKKAQFIDRTNFEKTIAKAYWQLFCPELDVSAHFSEFRTHVLSEAYRVLHREFGSNVQVHAFEAARSGTDGGLRGVLNTLMRLTLADLFKRHARVLVETYWNTSSQAELVRDSQDYVATYRDLIPVNMLEDGATLVRAHFRTVLIEHPNLILKLRDSSRR